MRFSKTPALLCGLLLLIGAVSDIRGDATATYISNAAVMVQKGHTKILFDPLYRLDHEYYLDVPESMENAILVGEPPFDDVDALFISHYHRDHFSPSMLLNYLMVHTEARVFAPEQVVLGLRQFASKDDAELLSRVTPLDLSSYGPSSHHELGGIVIEAVRVPHSGWPERNREVQNLVFRVTLDDEITIVHFGDADPEDEHFERKADFWSQRRADLVLPPYWFFESSEGLQILRTRTPSGLTVGVHVPIEVPHDPDQRDKKLRGFDLFTQPGESRTIPQQN